MRFDRHLARQLVEGRVSIAGWRRGPGAWRACRWLQAGGLLLRVPALAAVLLLLCWPFRFQIDPGFWHRAMDACHLPVFCGLTWLLHGAARLSPLRARSSHWVAGGLAAGLALAVEWLQPAVGREASLQDLVNGLLGVALAVTGLLAFQVRKALPESCLSCRIVWVMAGMCAVGYVVWPVWGEWQAIRSRDHRFPLLGDFETACDLRVWSPQGGGAAWPTRIAISPAHASRGRCSLQVRLGDCDWPGVNFNAGNMDWSGHRKLAFDIFNPGPPFELALRIDDDGDCTSNESRYVSGFGVTNGWNRVALPLSAVESGPRSRKLNLRAIRRLVLFHAEPTLAPEFFLDHMRLE